MVEVPSAPPPAPEEATFDLWIVGVVLAALSNMLSSLGLLVMKVSADQDKGKACHRRWRSPWSLTLTLTPDPLPIPEPNP